MGPPSTTHIHFLLAIVLFVILLQYCHCGSSIKQGAIDHVELENQLRILNKTPIKTIKTEIGDIFDCININKQPSIDHPLLKNHVIKTRPISYSTNTMVDHDQAIASSFVKPSSRITRLRKFSCSEGTVPIRRTSKDDLIRAKSFSKTRPLFSHTNNVGNQLDNDLEDPDHGQFFSIAKTRKDSGINYVGIKAGINVYNPPINENQVSTGQLWIENTTPGEEFNNLQAGWMVSPHLYADNNTRLFAKWQDGAGNWWLYVGEIKIGYWPAELGFSQLTNGSPVIAWGGLAEYLGEEETTVPPMGNGNYPGSHFDYQRHCYMRSRNEGDTCENSKLGRSY